jgi:hypothetical protein
MPKFELYKHNDELFNIYYGIFFELLPILTDYANYKKRGDEIFGREPSNDYFIKILFLLSKWFQTRRFLWEFPIGSNVKLSSAVAAILVGDCVHQYRPVAKMAAITKNRMFFQMAKTALF